MNQDKEKTASLKLMNGQSQTNGAHQQQLSDFLQLLFEHNDNEHHYIIMSTET